MNTWSRDIASDAPLEYQNNEAGSISGSFYYPAPISPEDVDEAALVPSLIHGEVYAGFTSPVFHAEEVSMTSVEDQPTQSNHFLSPPAPQPVVRTVNRSERTSRLRLVESI